MIRFIPLIAFLSLYIAGLSQVAPDKYFIEFTDKNHSPYSLDRPQEFLSWRAMDRRASYAIPIDSTDLPVTPAYVDSVSQVGVTVITRCKWFNGITVFTSDPGLISIIENFHFVKRVIKNSLLFVPSNTPTKFLVEYADRFPVRYHHPISFKCSDSSEYGLSFTQVHMVNADYLHDQGYRGEGIEIAVLDAGFLNANIIPALDSLRTHNQILGTQDFVEPGGNVYTGHPHGTEVLSIMGGNLPGQLIGTAPKAAYWLLRSEDASSEYLIEEYNWISAAEFADSAGTDVINSSLGYRVFDDSTQNHTCTDMNGHTTPVTRGANIAFSKGILVVNSAGNEGGNTSWPCVSAPSDGDDVIGVGAVDSLRQYASFSSTGVVNGSYVKPNIAAMGRLTVLASPDGTIMRSNGTSFSSPIIAGSIACLWQARKSYSNSLLKAATEASGSQFTHPDKYLGFGIPDFKKALESLDIPEKSKNFWDVIVFPNPFASSDPLNITVNSPSPMNIRLELFNMMGIKIVQDENIQCRPGISTIPVTFPTGLEDGLYLIVISNPGNEITRKLIKVQRLTR